MVLKNIIYVLLKIKQNFSFDNIIYIKNPNTKTK
jgi:hypothetical protein